MKYDCIVIGAGPAGLFASYILKNKKVLIIEKGNIPSKRKCPMNEKGKCVNCNPCNILAGIGGAGLFSDGKLNFIHKLGKTDLTEFVSEDDAIKVIEKTEKIFDKFGMNGGKIFPTDIKKAKSIKSDAKGKGIDLLLIKQRHLGSDNLPSYMTRFMDYLKEKGVKFKTQTEAQDIIIKDGKAVGVITDKGEFFADSIIAAPGRVGSKWFYDTAKKLGLDLIHRGIEVGVRVEVPKEVMEEATDIIYDPTFFIYTDTYDDQVRTFCTNKTGFVSKEKYHDFVCVNGHACTDKHSNNTNFALLSKVVLNDPVTDNYSYGKSIGRIATVLGGGKPLLQRYIDLKKGRRSTWERIRKSYVKPTMTDVVPGDISMALPKRIVTNLIEALEKLNKIIPGIASNATLLYAPEIKFFSTQVKTDPMMKTDIDGLYVAGDGAGVAGNIVGAAATGIMAAEGILKATNNKTKNNNS